jgi:hypothetical protein
MFTRSRILLLLSAAVFFGADTHREVACLKIDAECSACRAVAVRILSHQSVYTSYFLSVYDLVLQSSTSARVFSIIHKRACL